MQASMQDSDTTVDVVISTPKARHLPSELVRRLDAAELR